MVIFVPYFADWLVGLIADAGTKKLVSFVRGGEPERALRQACRAALTETAAELRPGDTAAAAAIAMVIAEVFETPAAQLAGDHRTLLEALQAAIAAQLRVLDDPDITTEPGRSSFDALGLSGAVVAEKLASHLVQEIIGRGILGGSLEPLANQLGHDRSYLLGLQLQGKIDHLDDMLANMLTTMDPARMMPEDAVQRAGRQGYHQGAASGRPQAVIRRHDPTGTSRPGRQQPPHAAETPADSSRSEIRAWWPSELHPAPNFSGRADELARLDRWAADAHVNLIGLTGWGGAGKTALAANWVRELGGLQKRAGLRGVFGWSFYANSSADQWASDLLAWASNDLGIKLPEVKRIAARVLDLLRSVPLMLVLDGLEVVQRSPDDDEYGKFLNGILREVLTGACLIDHDGLILLTSRFPFADFEFFDGGRARMLELPPLTLGDGSALLAAAGGDWLPEDRRRELVGAVDGHAMAVSILASLLAERPPVSYVAALAADLLLAARTEARVNKVLEFYAARLVESDRYLLAAVCLFARPVSVDALVAVSEHDAFGGRLAGWTPDMVESAVRNRLTGLVSWHPDGTVSVHPLVRDAFRPLAMGAARNAADATLAGIPEREVSSYADALRVVEAIELLLDADHWEAAEDLYKIRCGDGKALKALSAPRLGQRVGLAFMRSAARRADYIALTRGPFYVSAVGYFSMYTGDLAIALDCQRRTVDRIRNHRDRQTTSAQYTYPYDSSNLSANIEVLSECHIYLGNVTSARDTGLAALREAEYSGNPRRILSAHAWLGWLAGLAGDTNQAEEQWASAENIALAPESDHPYSLIAARWAEWLLLTGRMAPARAIASYGLKASRKRGWNEEAARCEQLLGRLELSVGNTVKAQEHLEAAADCFQTGEHLVELARTLIHLGAYMQQAGNLTDANRHADEAIAIAAPRGLALVQCSALGLRATIRADQGASSADRTVLLAGRDDADAALRLSVRHRLPWHELEAISAHAHLDRTEGIDHGWGARADALNARLIPAGLDPDPIAQADRDLDALADQLSARLDERTNEWRSRSDEW